MNPLLSYQRSSPATWSFLSQSTKCLNTPSRRHTSSYRRSKSRLNIKPDASFLPSTTETHDHIIYNPPPSAPNIYHTPTVFLPKNDKRRQLHDLASQRISQLADTSSLTSSWPPQQEERLPPPLRKPYEKRYHLGEKEVAEMRQLRKDDPGTWSGSKLAKKFDCSKVFVQFVTEGLSKEKQEMQKRVTEVVKSRWGVKRRVAREDRAIRKERWYSDS